MNRYVYSFIPIGVALVAGGIQTAIIGYSFGAAQWYIAALLIVCVWLTVSMDAAAFHHSALHGATGLQKTFLAISAVSLVLVLSVDLVWMFAPEAFNTTDVIIRDLSYATGVNLAVSTFCLLAWIFFSQDHKDEREAAQMEADTRREQRLAWLQSDEAKRFFGDEVRIEHIERIAKRRKRTAFAIAEESKIIDQSKATPALPSQPAPLVQSVPQADPLADTTPAERALLAAVLQKTRGTPANGGTYSPQDPKA